MNNLKIPIIFLFTLFSLLGCNSSKGNPTIPTDSLSDSLLPTLTTDSNSSNHTLLGTWSVTFDFESFTALVKPARNLTAHHNITGMIPDPLIEVRNWDPVEEIADVDITLHNPYWVTAYDVRLIIYTDSAGHTLKNADNWISLWDIPDGLNVNPFKAYSKTEPNRAFTGFLWLTENFKIHCPNNDYNVQFAIDASYPSNCEEPYEISGFAQGILEDETGAMAAISVDVPDWQNDVDSVVLYCPQVTDVPSLPFTQVNSKHWIADLTNNTGASAGEYSGFITAISSSPGSVPIYKGIEICITPALTGEPSNPEIIGSIIQPGGGDEVFIKGDYAYYVGLTNFRIADISNPQEIKRTSIIELGTMKARRIEVNGNYAFIACSSDGLMIIDVSDPFNPEIVTILDSIKADDIKIEGDYGYAACGSEGLTILDMLNPVSPEIISNTDTDGSSHGVTIEGNKAYIADWKGLVIMDISDPYEPDIMGYYIWDTHLNCAIEVVVQGNYAYVADGYGDLRVIDITDPSAMDLVATVNVYNAISVDVQGDYAYVANYSDYVKVVDISDPPQAESVATIQTNGMQGGIDVEGDYLYIPAFNGLWVADITDPANPDLAAGNNAFHAKGVKVKGDYAFVLTASNGLFVIDIHDQSNPFIVTSITNNHSGTDFGIKDDFLFLLSNGWGIFSFDISDPENPEFVGEIPDILAFEMVIQDDFAYLIGSSEAFHIVDISNPTDMELTSKTETFGYAKDVAVSGNYAYIVYYDEGLTVIDIANPFAPELIGNTQCTHYAKEIKVNGNHAFIADGYRGLIVVNIDNPEAPYIVDSLSLGGRSDYLTISPDFAYVSNLYDGVRIIDITSLSNITLVNSMDFFGTITEMDLRDKYAYLPNSYGEFLIVQLWE